MAVQDTVISLDAVRQRVRAGGSSGLFTITEVSQACGLPGPVIMQLVPRTWVEPVGWLYTGGQIRRAIAIAQELRQPAK